MRGRPRMDGMEPFLRSKTAPWVIGSATLLLAVMVAGYDGWWSTTTASRTDVASAMGALDPACRPVVAARFKDKIVREGRPLDRGEMRDLVGGVHDCAQIDQQIAGLGDG